MNDHLKFREISGKIRVKTGLHIGAGDSQMQIGGIDKPVIKNSTTGQPYIPGSSLKGKMRSLLETYHGFSMKIGGHPLSYNDIKKFNNDKLAENIVKLFGNSAANSDDEAKKKMIGIARGMFWDAYLSEDWINDRDESGQTYTEEKFENSINRLTSEAQNPRKIERVPERAEFKFSITLRYLVNDELNEEKDLMNMLLTGMKLVEMTGLGGSSSRGYGKVKFEFDDDELKKDFDEIKIS